MSDKDFIVKNNLTVNGALTANSSGLYFSNTLSLNSNSYQGTSNNTLNVGSVAAANVVSNSQLQSNLAGYVTLSGLASNVATLSANNSTFLGGTAYTAYVTLAGLTANVLTLTSNSTNFVGTTSAANVVSNAQLQSSIQYFVNTSQLTANLSNYAQITGTTFTGPVTYANTLFMNGPGYNLVIGTQSGIVANNYIGTPGQALLSNGSSVYWASVNSSVIAAPGSNGNILVSLSNSIYASNGLTVNTSTNTVSIGNTSVNATINSTAYTGSANNATNLGGAPYTAYVNTSGSFTVGGILTYNANLVVNTGNYIVLGNTSVNAIVNSTVYSGTSNNATNLGGTAASGYQTTAGLSANVLILTSNNTSYVGSSPASSIVNATSLAANLSYYSTTTIVQGWISGNSATAYSNAVSYAASAAATAYSNAVSYAPSKTGSGASGTWPINISGSAATLSGYTINQNLGTSNTPTFAGLESTGIVEIYGRSYSQPSIRIRDVSAGQISFYDNVDPELGIYNYTLSMDSGVYGFYFSTTNTAYDTGSQKASIDYNGNIIAAGNMTAYGSPSDRRLKENIAPVKDALHKILALNPVTYDWKKETKEHTMVGMTKDIGFIAQEVQEVIPELVREGGDGYLAIRDRGIIALLVEAIKELQTQVDELKGNR